MGVQLRGDRTGVGQDAGDAGGGAEAADQQRAVPGIDPGKDVQVTLQDGTLCITRERGFTLPEGAAGEGITASYRNGGTRGSRAEGRAARRAEADPAAKRPSPRHGTPPDPCWATGTSAALPRVGYSGSTERSRSRSVRTRLEPTSGVQPWQRAGPRWSGHVGGGREGGCD